MYAETSAYMWRYDLHMNRYLSLYLDMEGKICLLVSCCCQVVVYYVVTTALLVLFKIIV